MRKATLLFVAIFVLIINSSYGYYSEDKMIELLQSSDIQSRIMALKNLNTGLKRGELQITPKLKTILDIIIEDQMNGKNEFNAYIDEEGQYSSEVNLLMLRINEEKYLPYFMQSGFGPIVKVAIFKHGEKAYEMALKLGENFNDLNYTRKAGYIIFMADMLDTKRTGFVATGEKRKKIKDLMMRIYSNIKYPDSNDKEYDHKIANLSREVIKPYLTFFNVLGDKDVIPLVEKISEEDNYKETYRKKYYKYIKMSQTEQFKHMGEFERMAEEDKKKKQIVGAAAMDNEEMVVEYPNREKARKILDELKRKHGMQ